MDIYSFGMCVLYIITREDPYLECNGVISKIIDRILHKKLPNSLSRVTHSTALNFITSCLQYDFNARPSATELLNHHFLEFLQDEDDMEVSIGPEVEDDYTYSSTLLSHHTRFSGSNETTNDSISPVSNDRTEIDVASNNTQTLDSSTTPIKSSSDVPSSNVGNNSKVNMKEVGTSPFITIPTIQEGYPSKIDGTERVNYSMIAVSESSLSGKLFDNDVSENINQNNNISPGLNTESVSSSQMKEVIINLKVDATHSSDGLEKHVEFVFNIEKDNSMVSLYRVY
jgi:serine/threonine protein kinase